MRSVIFKAILGCALFPAALQWLTLGYRISSRPLLWSASIAGLAAYTALGAFAARKGYRWTVPLVSVSAAITAIGLTIGGLVLSGTISTCRCTDDMLAFTLNTLFYSALGGICGTLAVLTKRRLTGGNAAAD